MGNCTCGGVDTHLVGCTPITRREGHPPARPCPGIIVGVPSDQSVEHCPGCGCAPRIERQWCDEHDCHQRACELQHALRPAPAPSGELTEEERAKLRRTLSELMPDNEQFVWAIIDRLTRGAHG
jgi:hypothetical protein